MGSAGFGNGAAASGSAGGSVGRVTSGAGDRILTGFEIGVQLGPVFTVFAADDQLMLAARFLDAVPVKGRMGIAQPHHVEQRFDNRTLHFLPDILNSIEPAVHIARLPGFLKQVKVVGSREQSLIVDLGNAGREDLDGTGQQIGCIILAQG